MAPTCSRMGLLMAEAVITQRSTFVQDVYKRQPQDGPEPENGVMTPALMNGQSFVVQCDATDAEMRQFLKKYKIGTERRCHVIDDQSNITMVEAGLGISIMPQMLLRDCKAAVKVYPIEPEEYRCLLYTSSIP